MKERAVSEVIGAILLIAVAVGAIAVVSTVLLSGPLPTQVPHFSGIISNRSTTVYLSHEGGDTLYRGQYKILVDGVDQTANFVKSFTEPWSAGKVMNYTFATMPGRVVLVFNASGAGEIVLLSADLTTTTVATQPYPTVTWSNSPAFANTTTPIQFTDVSTGTILSYSWIFNDGSTSASKSPSHTFPCASATDVCTYSINHSAIESAGTPEAATTWLNRSSWVTIYENATPTVDFSANTRNGANPLSVTFTATQYGPIKVDNWYWTFGEGGTSTSQNPVYSYTTVGTFTVTLRAANNTLGTTTVTKTDYIKLPAWYSCYWLYRKNITLWKSKVSNGPLTNFPVLINYTDSDLSARAQADGDDILFTKADGTTKIPHEIEYYPGGGVIVAWVNVSSISSAANTTIYLYYGNSTVSSRQDRTNVWDSDYFAVWHMNETPTTNVLDSSKKGNYATPGSSMVSGDRVDGKIGKATEFDGAANDNLVSSSNMDISSNTARTTSFWMKRYNANDAGMVHWGTTTANKMWGAVVWNSGKYMIWGWDTANDYNTAQAVEVNSWHYHALTHDGTTANWYEDFGTKLGAGFTHAYNTQPNTKVQIGRMVDKSATYYTNGIIDEVRISDIARSVDWIKTEYNNQNEPSTFHYPGSQESWTC